MKALRERDTKGELIKFKNEDCFKAFHELTIQELYNILQLRSEVFVVEQNCIYQDIDGKDKAVHIFIEENKDVLAYSRVFNEGEYFENPSIGRVVVKKEKEVQS